MQLALEKCAVKSSYSYGGQMNLYFYDKKAWLVIKVNIVLILLR